MSDDHIGRFGGEEGDGDNVRPLPKALLMSSEELQNVV